MTSLVTWASHAAVIGAGATAALDLWSLYVARAFGVKGLDYGLLGRWIGGLLTGKGWRQDLSTAAPVGAERAIGWVAHYAIGVLFAAGLLGSVGQNGRATRRLGRRSP